MPDDKDRRSRMATSTVNAPAKKGGAGGHFTWGAAGDVKDFEPVGTSALCTKVTTNPAEGESAPAVPHGPSAGSLGINVDSESQFPALPSKAARQQPGPPTSVWRDAQQPQGLVGALHAYDSMLRSSPLRTKLLTAAVTNVASELLSYRLAGVEGSVPGLLRQCVIGVSLTGIVHRWYAAIERVFAGWPKDSALTVAVKTALQMAILEPTLAATYLVAKKLLSGQRDILPTIWAQLAKLTLASWSVWGPTAVMQYRFVPVDYRNLVSNFVNLFYTVYLIATTTTSKQPALSAQAASA
mmetsp:Transcript_8666/g.17946  ORF Transcript_8666/g.17946 Transcript_8666/m.17946 type:complete len:297 (-) Transcript_8666:166-1056(-)